MSTTGDLRCPNCGNTVPAEIGQHADTLISGRVDCPHCGEAVTLRDEAAGEETGDAERAAAAPPGRTEQTESFSGNETAAGVAEELRDKPT